LVSDDNMVGTDTLPHMGQLSGKKYLLNIWIDFFVSYVFFVI